MIKTKRDVRGWTQCGAGRITCGTEVLSNPPRESRWDEIEPLLLYP